MTKTFVYCDYNAGAPVRPEAAAAVARALEAGGNPSSVHAAGRRVRAMIEDARETLAGAVGTRADNVVFTSGATEALHLALDSAGPASLIVSAVEHDAVYEHAARRGGLVAPVDGGGIVDLDALAALLAKAPKPALVAVQLANNETGVIQPIAKIAAVARTHGAMLLVDAAQAFGRIPVDIVDLDATYIAVSSHKIGGPPGAGALILALGAPFVTPRFGGGQERGRRPGTENAAAIAGFGVATEIATARVNTLPAPDDMRRQFETCLPDHAVIFATNAPRLWNTSNFALAGVTAETAVIAMDLEGVCVSSGAACSSGKVKSSRVLKAMGVDPDLARCALRVSVGWESTPTDIGVCLAALYKVSSRRRLGAA